MSMAPENGALRKNRMSIKGSRLRLSAATSATALAAAPTNSAMISPEPHPHRGPSMMAAVVHRTQAGAETQRQPSSGATWVRMLSITWAL
jgi:hypothetical protein